MLISEAMNYFWEGRQWAQIAHQMYATGILGRRTEHQADAKAQLMVHSTRKVALEAFEADEAANLEHAGSDKNVLELAEESASNGDILEEIRLVHGAGAHCLKMSFTVSSALTFGHGKVGAMLASETKSFKFQSQLTF